MDRIRGLCYNLGNCTVVVYLLEVSVVTCYKINSFNLVTSNPGGADKRRWRNWYTRKVEGLMAERLCGFKSRPAHQIFEENLMLSQR